MAEELIQVLGLLNDGSQIGEAEAYIKEHSEQDKFGFISKLTEIIGNESISPSIRSRAIVLLWGQYPAEISDLSEDSIETQIPPELTANILQISFSLLTGTHNNNEFYHYSAELYARCASFAIHINQDPQPFHLLIQTINESEDVNLIQHVAASLSAMLETYYPEEAEARELFNLTLRLFGDANCLLSAINILEKIVEFMNDFFNSEEEDSVDENQEIMQQIIAILVQLTEESPYPSKVFWCWEKVGKFVPGFLASNADGLIPYICSALQSDDRDLLFAACSLLQRITKIEIDDETEVLQCIEQNYPDIIAMLADVCSSVPTPDCDSNEAWEPYIAATEALGTVCEIAADLIASNMGDVISALLGSQAFSEKDTGLKIIYYILKYTTEPINMKEFLSAASEFIGDEAPCVRYHALKCLRVGYSRIAELDKSDASLIELSSNAEGLTGMLEDEPQIASEVALLLALFTEIPGYDKTHETLQLLFDKANSLPQYDSAHVYKAVENICRDGTPESVLQFFPVIVEAYSAVFQGEEEEQWRLHDFGELLQVFCFRFKEQLAEYCEHLGHILLEAAGSQSNYSNETLLPIAALSTTNREVFTAMLPNIYQLYLQALELRDNYTVYAAATSISLILLQNYPIDNIQQWIELFVNILSSETVNMNSRSALVNVINTIACKFPEEYHVFAMTIIGYVRTYCQELSLRYSDDKKGHQNLASRVAELLLTTLKNLGTEVNEDIIEMTGELILFFAELESVEDDLMQNILPLILYLVTNFRQFITELMENNPEIMMKIETVSNEVDLYSETCQKTANQILQQFATSEDQQ